MDYTQAFTLDFVNKGADYYQDWIIAKSPPRRGAPRGGAKSATAGVPSQSPPRRGARRAGGAFFDQKGLSYCGQNGSSPPL